jgi:hypothetical protein
MTHGHELTTVATGAGSLVAALLGVTKRVPHNVGRHLATLRAITVFSLVLITKFPHLGRA